MDAARKLAELMNRRDQAGPAGQPSDVQLERIAAAVYELIGAQAGRRLKAKLRDWPRVADDADDLQQLAVVAFVTAYRAGRIRPDPASGAHTAASVSAYLWGVCNRVFLRAVRRSRPGYAQLEEGWQMPHGNGAEGLPSELAELIAEPAGDDEARVWEVLSAVRESCRPGDIIMALLQCCGFTAAELGRLLRVSERTPYNALRRVGGALRKLLGLERGGLAASGNSKHGARPTPPAAESPLSLLLAGRHAELLDWITDPRARSYLLEEACAAVSGATCTSADLATRMHSFTAEGDWSWGLLSREERLELLLRDFAMLYGSGTADGGTGQRAALESLRSKLGEICTELGLALDKDDLEWALPIAEHLGGILGITGESKQARDVYRMVLECSLRLGERRLELIARLRLGDALLRLGNYGSAREQVEQALSISRDLSDRHAEAKSIYKIGVVAQSQGDFASARQMYMQALAMARELEDRNGESNCLGNLGQVEICQGNFDAATELISQALTICREIGNLYGATYCLNDMGDVERSQGNYNAARELFSQSLDICRELGFRRGEAVCLNCLGIVEDSLANFPAAQLLYVQALAIHRDLGNKRGEAGTLHNLGKVEGKQGNYSAATELYQQALGINREIGNRVWESFNLLELGIVASFKNDYVTARDMYSQTLPIIRELGNQTMLCHLMFCTGETLTATRSFHQSSVAIYCAQTYAAELSYRFEPQEQQILESALARLDAAVASGEISADDLARWKAEGEALSLDELAEFTLAALQEARAALDG